MKTNFNRFAILPVECEKCHRYVWLEKYRSEKYWHEYGIEGIWLTKCVCDECLSKVKKEREN